MTLDLNHDFIYNLARRYDIEVHFELITDGREAYAQNRRVILNPDVYLPRLNYAFCHELAHILLGHTQQNHLRADIEREADRLAVELILPEAEFRQAMQNKTFLEIKACNPQASWEAVARRWAEFRPAVLTISDNGKITARCAPESLQYPPRTVSSENAIIARSFKFKSHQTDNIDRLNMQAYYIDDGRGFERVILLTEFDLDDF
ncbi:MAG: ImmA/IrrE family metallo-endopeptidase [Calditrichaeota bacterium]|nr:ImmA/IrrE family metallo-endopeptidase [Calditrichota bacterium]